MGKNWANTASAVTQRVSSAREQGTSWIIWDFNLSEIPVGQGRRDKLCDPRVALLCICWVLFVRAVICRVCFINKFVAPIVKGKKKSAS